MFYQGCKIITITLGYVLINTMTMFGMTFCGDAGLFLVVQNRNHKSAYVQQTLVMQSKIQCTAQCFSDGVCQSVSWESLSGACQLTSLYTVHNGLNNYYLEYAYGWVTISRNTIPVVSYEGPGGRYSLTYADGEAFCSDLNANIASPEALVQALNMGYHICTCGWLSNGDDGMVLTADDCGLTASPDVIPCYHNHPYANVFCEMPYIPL